MNNDTKKQWHEGFYGAMEMELRDDASNLIFDREHYLSKEPLRVDMLIIKKAADLLLANEIGRIFKGHNVIEYKSPKDGLTIDDYVKTVGYACIYKSLADTVDEIPIEDITVTLVRDTYPREMIKKLISLGNEVDEMAPGIYYVTGNTMFTTQIVVTSRLRMEHTWLRVLTDKIQENDAINFALKGNKVTTQGERNNVDAIYQISVMANIEFYEELKRRDELMCEALKMLMKPEIEESWQNGLEQGISQGISQGIIENSIQVYRNCIAKGMSKTEAIDISGIAQKDIPCE